MSNFEKVFRTTIELASDPHSALKGAHSTIVMTEWDESRKSSEGYVALISPPNLVARRIYNPEAFTGLDSASIG